MRRSAGGRVMSGERRQDFWVTAARLTALALGAFALALVCIHFTREYGRVAAIWPGNALILAVLLRLSPRSLPSTSWTPRWRASSTATSTSPSP